MATVPAGDSREAGPLAIPLPDADLLLYPRPDLGIGPDRLLAGLIHDTPWQQREITLFGRRHLQPRLVAWYGDEGACYTYSRTRFEPLPWTAPLAALRDRVGDLAGQRFNSVLLNCYRDQRDAMGLHADDEPELGPEPVIASLSLGEARSLTFRHRSRRDIPPFELPLPCGSVLLMRGVTQRYWKHGLRRLSRPCGARVNLTFRQVAFARG